MIPYELEETTLKLPDSDQCHIIIITGKAKRHQRFALRIQEEFGDLVKGWYEIDKNEAIKFANERDKKTNKFNENPESKLTRVIKVFREVGIVRGAKKAFRKMQLLIFLRGMSSDFDINQINIFDGELKRLENRNVVDKQKIHPRDINTLEFENELKSKKAYFLLTLGGPLYKDFIISSVEGAAINQHAGHSPDYKGGNTIDWALYNRDLLKVSSTVHITSTGADDGPILKRSNPTIFISDSPAIIFNKVVALGTELMIDAVKEIIVDKNMKVYDQPKFVGNTFLSKDRGILIMQRIYRDLKDGWLLHEIFRLRNF